MAAGGAAGEHGLLEALSGVALPGAPEVVVCMRDTVLCLPDRRDVASLAERVAASLAANGTFVLSPTATSPGPSRASTDSCRCEATRTA